MHGGYETRILVYRVGLDGKIMGLGIWDFHAQCQVKVGDEWKWSSGGILEDNPEYSMDGEVYEWQTKIYKGMLQQQGKYN